jgi:hypothetical protein
MSDESSDIENEARGSSDASQQPEADLETNALLSRLRVIEDQPLESRAAAYAQLHDTLQARLEGRDAVDG